MADTRSALEELVARDLARVAMEGEYQRPTPIARPTTYEDILSRFPARLAGDPNRPLVVGNVPLGERASLGFRGNPDQLLMSLLGQF